VKGSELTGYNNLKLIVLNGAEDILSEDDKQIKVKFIVNDMMIPFRKPWTPLKP